MSLSPLHGSPTKKKDLNAPKIWHRKQEELLQEWSETSSCYRWLHDRSHHKFKSQHMWFTLPVIVLQTLTGVLSFAHGNFEGLAKEYLPLFIGSLNILGGMITTISQFLQVGELKEGHRVASLEFSKLSRSIRIELALPLKERSHDGADFMNICRVKLDQLLEQSPAIREDVLVVFEKTFSEDIDNQTFALPEILDIHPVSIYDRTVDQAERKQAERVSSIVADAASSFKNMRRRRPSVTGNLMDKFKKAPTPRLSSVSKRRPSVVIDPREEVQKELGALMGTNAVKKLRQKYDSPQLVPRELSVDVRRDVLEEELGDFELPDLDGPVLDRETSLADHVSQMSQSSNGKSRRVSDASDEASVGGVVGDVGENQVTVAQETQTQGLTSRNRDQDIEESQESEGDGDDFHITIQ